MSGIPPPDVYLQSDFKSSTLKVAELRGLLLQYGISFSSTAKKAELLELFETRIHAHGPSILARMGQATASNHGIIAVSEDGTESVAAAGQKRARGKGRTSQNVEVDEVEVVETAPPKKRGRASRAVSAASTKSAVDDVPPVPEVPAVSAVSVPKTAHRRRKSEAVSEADDVIEVQIDAPTPPKSTRKPASRKSRASVPATTPTPSIPSAPSSSRRRSVMPSSASIASDIPVYEPPRSARKSTKKAELPPAAMDEVKEESSDDEPKRAPIKTPRKSMPASDSFTDFNPFQSGSEDAAERERRRRKSSIGLSAKKPAKPRFSEPAPKTDMSRSPSGHSLRRVGPSRENLRTPPKEVRDQAIAEREALERETAAGEDYNREVSAKMNEITTRRRGPEPIVEITTHTPSSRSVDRPKRVSDVLPVSAPRSVIPLGALFLLLLSFIANYKHQSSPIGFCDPASNTNDLILYRQSGIDDAKACIARRTAMDLENPGSGSSVHCDVSNLPLVPFLPRPTTCEPCPAHAICADGEVISCEPEYILTSHPLSVLSPVADGLPGVGPVAFPPSCRPDTARKRMVGGLAKSMEADLAKGRGLVVCAGMGKDDGRKGQGERFGVEETALRETYAQRRDPKFSQEQFDELFEAALKDLVEHDDVIESIDVDGRSWYAAARTDLTLACAAKLHLIDLLEQWRKQLISTAAVLAGIGYLRTTMKHRRREKYQAEELVQVVLKRLQDQEHLHYADPVTTANPFIPPTQLRDLVMPPKGSTTSRTRLWQRVQDLVEQNANVAVRDKEVRGEVWKTWEWQGVGERHITWGDQVKAE